MSWTLCTSGAAISKAGTNVNADIVVYDAGNATIMDKWSDEAEGRIQSETNTTWITNILAEPALSLSGALSDICSSMIAKELISYDPTGYLAREADFLMNMNDDKEIKGLKILRDKNKHTLRDP